MSQLDLKARNEGKFKELSDAIVSCKKEAVEAVVEKAIDEGIPSAEIIEKGLAPGMNEVGVLYEGGKILLAHVMMAVDVMEAGVELLGADMQKEAASKKFGAIPNITVETDVHNIGESVVSAMLQSYTGRLLPGFWLF